MSTASVTGVSPRLPTLASTIAAHWPEYLMEAVCLGVFMLSACAFTVLLEHPASPVHQAIDDAAARRAFMGVAMGATAVGIVFSKWGKRSGAHMNPALTLAYLSVGKIAWRDALFYVVAQFAGGVLGVLIADRLIGFPLRHSAVNYAVTVPGPDGPLGALVAEFLISGLLMAAILTASNHRRVARYTPFVAGFLVAVYIAFESPISGMSMNPARTLGSALSADYYPALWVYFVGPTLAMILAGQLYRFVIGARAIYCAKLHHDNNERCIFRCRRDQM